MADRPLRPATHRRLGGPLPHQLANGTRAPPVALAFMKRLALIPWSEDLGMSCGISPPFEGLSPTSGQVTHVLLTRLPRYRRTEARFRVRLACVRHAASVRSEPGSNSPVKVWDPAVRLSSPPAHKQTGDRATERMNPLGSSRKAMAFRKTGTLYSVFKEHRCGQTAIIGCPSFLSRACRPSDAQRCGARRALR